MPAVPHQPLSLDTSEGILGRFNPFRSHSRFFPFPFGSGGAPVTVAGVPKARKGPQELSAGVSDELVPQERGQPPPQGHPHQSLHLRVCVWGGDAGGGGRHSLDPPPPQKITPKPPKILPKAYSSPLPPPSNPHFSKHQHGLRPTSEIRRLPF